MQYDPVKNRLATLINHIPALRKLFFAGMDALLLRQRYVKAEMRRYFQVDNELSFYDAGAGFCQYSDYVLQHWQKSCVFALDLKTDYLKDYAVYAGAVYGKRFGWMGGDLVEYEPKQKYHLVAAIDILEHIENDRQVLTNFYNCMYNGGKLIISTPSDKDEVARFTAEHVRPGYRKEELEEKLQTAGFRIVSVKYSYGKYGYLAWKLAMKLPLIIVGKHKALMLVLPFYYLITYPIISILMQLDMSSDNEVGNGLIAVAEKV